MAKFNAVFKKHGKGIVKFKITQQTKEFYSKEFLRDVSDFLLSEEIYFRVNSINCPEFSLGEKVFYLRGDDMHQDKEWHYIYVDEADVNDVVSLGNQIVDLIKEYISGEYEISNPILRKIKSLDKRFKSGALRKTILTVVPLPLGE